MMSNYSIRALNLSKQYRIGARQQNHPTLRDQLSVGLKFLMNRGGVRADEPYMIDAVKEVSFEVKPGEVVGVIGRNGAGKSTLLKLLSRITAPSEGRLEILGRIGSLLEVGTGFHPELTGRENIYLNGAILGMKKAEIKARFDEIVEFAEVDRFVDTPVKRYSSGMYIRLAFAVAAHLEPDILLVDEVLAVGDGAFQKKCLHKMQEVGNDGRTILLVSHNMQSITRLCERAILLDAGRLIADDRANRVVSAYLNAGIGSRASREWKEPSVAPCGEVGRLRAVRVRDAEGRISDTIDIRHEFTVELDYDVLKSGYVLLPDFAFFNEQGIRAFSTHDLDPVWRGRERPVGRYTSRVKVPGNLLAEGMMTVNVGMQTQNPDIFQFSQPDVIAFQVVDTLEGNSARGDFAREIIGVVRPLLKWSTEFEPRETRPSLGALQP